MHYTAGQVHILYKDVLWLQMKTQQSSAPSYGTAGPDWDTGTTRTEVYRTEFSCSTASHRSGTITKKLHLILVHVMSLLTLSENCVSLPLLSPRNESCMCLKITRFTPRQNDGECTDITFSYTPRMASFSRCKAHIVFKATHILWHKACQVSWKPEHVYKIRVGWYSYIKSWSLKLISVYF